MQFYNKIFIFVVFLFGFVFSGSANLVITPTLIEFAERDRVKQVLLINPTNQIQTYNLEWTEFTQTDFGAYEMLNENSKASFATASQYLRFTPRRVTLKPGEKQTVKILLRRTANMKEGDHRSHLKFSSLPPEADTQMADQNGTSGISFKVDLLVNYTIPVIVRADSNRIVGVSFASGALRRLENQKLQVIAELKKDTPQTVIGAYEIHFRPNDSKAYELVGKLNNVNLFHENERFVSEIDWFSSIPAKNGKIKIIFKSNDLESKYIEYILNV